MSSPPLHVQKMVTRLVCTLHSNCGIFTFSFLVSLQYSVHYCVVITSLLPETVSQIYVCHILHQDKSKYNCYKVMTTIVNLHCCIQLSSLLGSVDPE